MYFAPEGIRVFSPLISTESILETRRWLTKNVVLPDGIGCNKRAFGTSCKRYVMSLYLDKVRLLKKAYRDY